MTSRNRSEQYRRRRQRTARSRKGTTRTRQRRVLRTIYTAPDSITSTPNGKGSEFRLALRQFTSKVRHYDFVNALLYRYHGQHVELRLIADHPMTAPVSLLAHNWEEELNRQHPDFTWEVEVDSTPPEAEDRYHCLYWYPI